MKDVLIICYSRTGLTRQVALDLRARLDADFEDIREGHRRRGPLAYLWGRWQASRGMACEIAPPLRWASDYRALVLALPNWAGALCPAMRAWLLEQGRPLPPYATLITQSDSGADQVRTAVTQLIGAPDRAHLCLTDRQIAEQDFHAALTPFARGLPSALGLTQPAEGRKSA